MEDQETMKPPVKGYDLSTDYVLLWDLIGSSHRVAAWIMRERMSNGEPHWVIVEVKRYRDFNYTIGTQGVGYEGYKDTKEDLIETCKRFHLHFINPEQ